MNKRAFIIGYYGSSNLGDELLLSETVEILQAHISRENIKALSYNVELTQKIHGIKGISRNKFIRILKTIKDSDFLIGGGGSMLQNVTSNRSLIYYLALINAAFIFRKKVILLGNGIGPIKGKLQEYLVKRTLLKVDYLHLRDEDSYKWIHGSGHVNIDLGTDLALQRISVNKNQKKDCVIINLRNWKNIDTVKTAVKDLIVHVEASGYEVILLSMQKNNDDQVLKSLGTVCQFDNLAALRQKVESARFIVGMRLHLLILGAVFSIPFLGLAYDPKVSSFCKKMGQPFFENLESLKSSDLIEAFETMKNNECLSVQTIQHQLVNMESANLRMLEKVENMLRGQNEKN